MHILLNKCINSKNNKNIIENNIENQNKSYKNSENNQGYTLNNFPNRQDEKIESLIKSDNNKNLNKNSNNNKSELNNCNKLTNKLENKKEIVNKINNLDENKNDLNKDDLNIINTNDNTILKGEKNKTNFEHYQLSNIETETNNKINKQKNEKDIVININQNEQDNFNNIENNKLINEDNGQLSQSPSFSKEDPRKEDNKNGFEINKINDYSFKNSINNSNNNFNRNLPGINNNSDPKFNEKNIANNINTKYKNNIENSNIINEKKKLSNKSSNFNSKIQLINNKEVAKNINNNNNFSSFKIITNMKIIQDEELQKIYQTLSDINEVNIEKNNPNNYMTYPFEKTNELFYTVIKEIPLNIKKRISTFYMKIEKEKEIRKISERDEIIPSMKDLEKKINQIRKELKLIDINDYYNIKIEQLHFSDLEEDKEMDDKLYKMSEDLNNEFYNNIDEKLEVAKEKINELTL